SEQCGLRPDLLCLGKGLTGGYLPQSATVASQRVFDAFLGPDLSEQTLYHGHSYGGNALACAVARRHLELLDERDVLANVRARAAPDRRRAVGRDRRGGVGVSWRDWADAEAAAIRDAGRWREPRDLDAAGPEGKLVPDGRPVVSFASNDYLGLTQHPHVVAAAH